MFQGNASAALDFYSAVYSDFSLEEVHLYDENEQSETGTIEQPNVVHWRLRK